MKFEFIMKFKKIDDIMLINKEIWQTLPVKLERRYNT